MIMLWDQASWTTYATMIGDVTDFFRISTPAVNKTFVQKINETLVQKSQTQTSIYHSSRWKRLPVNHVFLGNANLHPMFEKSHILQFKNEQVPATLFHWKHWYAKHNL